MAQNKATAKVGISNYLFENSEIQNVWMQKHAHPHFQAYKKVEKTSTKKKKKKINSQHVFLF